MLRNLRAEMERNRVSICDIQNVINKSLRSTRDKINGKYDFTLPEAISIRNILFPGMRIEYLFADETENTAS